MALEIERRFLVAGDGWRPHSRWHRQLRQGYLALAADGLTVRVRTDGERAWLTIKARAAAPAREDAQPASLVQMAGSAMAGSAMAGSAMAGPEMVRHEFEYAIPLPDAEQLLALAPQQLSKCRHGLDLPGGEWVLDVFAGANAPLVVAEVELASTSSPVLVPDWCVQEITGRHELSNAALARQPLASWPEASRRELLEQLR